MRPFQPGRSSLWARRHRRALAAYPRLRHPSDVAILGCLTDEQSIVSAWPCSRRGLPGRAHYWTTPVVSYTTFSPSPCGCLFLWPDPAGNRWVSPAPAPGVTRRRALWSADFPRPRIAATAIARPTWGFLSYYTLYPNVNHWGKPPFRIAVYSKYCSVCRNAGQICRSQVK